MKVDKKETTEHEGGEVNSVDKLQARRQYYLEKNPDFKVEDHGMSTETGIQFNRSCTDFCCVIFFLVFVGCMFGVAIFGLIKGHPKAMMKPYDFTTEICGVNDTVKDYGKLYFTQLAPTWSQTADPSALEIARKIFFEEAVCVKACPTKTGVKVECPPGAKYDAKCGGVVGVTTTSMMDICWPHWSELSETEKENWRMVTEAIKTNPFFMQLMNLQTAWVAILTSLLTGFLLCVLYIYFMSVFAEYVAWGLIILTQIAFIAITLTCFYFFATMSGDTKYAPLGIGILFALLSILYAIALYCGWDQLKLAIEIVNCSADFLANTKRMLGVPIIYYAILFLYFLFWLSCVISVECMGKIVPDPGDSLVYVPLNKDIEWGDRPEMGQIVNWMLAFLIFALVWFVFFLQASNNYVVMVTASTYYFTSTREKLGAGQVTTGIRWAWVHNFGSLAFGSIIITIIFLVRTIVYYFFKKAEKLSGDNGCVKCISCVVICFLKCIEEIVEYITRAGFAYMAIAGESFCKSCYDGLILNFKHGIKFGFANYLAWCFIMVGKVGITILNVVIAWLFMSHVTGSAQEVSNPFVPLIFVGVVSYLIVAVFLGLFDESVLAMMTSVTADMDLNGDGKADWGPATLHEVLDSMEDDKDEKDGK